MQPNGPSVPEFATGNRNNALLIEETHQALAVVGLANSETVKFVNRDQANYKMNAMHGGTPALPPSTVIEQRLDKIKFAALFDDQTGDQPGGGNYKPGVDLYSAIEKNTIQVPIGSTATLNPDWSITITPPAVPVAPGAIDSPIGKDMGNGWFADATHGKYAETHGYQNDSKVVIDGKGYVFHRYEFWAGPVFAWKVTGLELPPGFFEQ